jgi:hypothetical protein
MLLPTQVFVLLKSPGLVPVMLTAVTLSAAVPLLVTVTAWLVLVVPMFWFAKVRLMGESATAGAAGGVFSIAMIWPPRRMYSFEGLDGSVLCAKESTAMVRNTENSWGVLVGLVIVWSLVVNISLLNVETLIFLRCCFLSSSSNPK